MKKITFIFIALVFFGFVFVASCGENKKPTRMITADVMRTITDVDDSFERLDIRWLSRNAQFVHVYERGVMCRRRVRAYIFTEENETSKIRIEGDRISGFSAHTFFHDSHFVIQRFFYPTGNIERKGWHFNWRRTTNMFMKGVWYYFDESGRLIKTIDYDAPFKFTFEDVLEFCRKEGIVLPKGYNTDRLSANIFRRSPLVDIDLLMSENPEWVIVAPINSSWYDARIVLDGISGKVLSRDTISTLPTKFR